MLNLSYGQKISKFSNLREVTPKNAMETKIFSSNLIDVPKLKLSPKKHCHTMSLFKSTQSYQQNKNINWRNAIRKQTENKILTLAQYQQKKFSSEQQINNFHHSSFSSKSFTSTNANTQRSQKLNLSGEQISDNKLLNQKYYINHSNIITEHYQQSKSEKNDNQNMTIQDFNIIDFCGQGAFGSVYTAQHKLTGAIYALKKILKATVSNQVDKQSLIRQIKIHLKLNHPNIVKLYGVFSTQKAVYFVMELCNSGNLYQLLRQKGPFQQSQVTFIVKQVCSALNYLHDKNIIHRDIKAQNIVVQDKVVKICDFGWASQGEYSRKSLCGTPAYISPQVVQNKLYDKKVDVWSMGVLVFELIFGRIPFDIKSQQDLRKIVEQQLLFPQYRNISLECKDFIMKCLQKDSFKRWDTSRLLSHAFLKRE